MDHLLHQHTFDETQPEHFEQWNPHDHRELTPRPKPKFAYQATVEDCADGESEETSDEPLPGSPGQTMLSTPPITPEKEVAAIVPQQDAATSSSESVPQQTTGYTGGQPMPDGVLQYLDEDSPSIYPDTSSRPTVPTNIDANPNSPTVTSTISSASSSYKRAGSSASRKPHRWIPDHAPQPQRPIVAAQTQHHHDPNAWTSPTLSQWSLPSQQSFAIPAASPVISMGYPHPEMNTARYGRAPGSVVSMGGRQPSLPPTPMSAQSVPYTAQHLPGHPPPWRPPMSGYQHVAHALCSPMPGNPGITPVYRRFEALNHRLLLQVQDEIVQLEQDLESLDADDTMSRYGPMGCAPASRRAESMAQGELGWRKHGLYMDIGLKLAQYSKMLESFRTMQSLPTPSVREIEDYKGFLARSMAICEPETRFLQVENDLISLPPQEWEEPEEPGGINDPSLGSEPFKQMMPPMPANAVQPSPRLEPSFADNMKGPPVQTHEPKSESPLHLVYAAFLAVAIPMVTFTVVHGLGERMVIVLLVFSGVATAVYQSGLAAEQGIVEYVGCAGLYGLLMAGLAHVFVY